jgi:PAS domain-containing protein
MERLRSQRERTQSEERFRQIAETVQDGFWVMDAVDNRSLRQPVIRRHMGIILDRQAKPAWNELISTQKFVARNSLTREFQIAAADGLHAGFATVPFPSRTKAEVEQVIGEPRRNRREAVAGSPGRASNLFSPWPRPPRAAVRGPEEGRLTLMNQYSREMFRVGG